MHASLSELLGLFRLEGPQKRKDGRDAVQKERDLKRLPALLASLGHQPHVDNRSEDEDEIVRLVTEALDPVSKGLEKLQEEVLIIRFRTLTLNG